MVSHYAWRWMDGGNHHHHMKSGNRVERCQPILSVHWTLNRSPVSVWRQMELGHTLSSPPSLPLASGAALHEPIGPPVCASTIPNIMTGDELGPVQVQ